MVRSPSRKFSGDHMRKILIVGTGGLFLLLTLGARLQGEQKDNKPFEIPALKCSETTAPNNSDGCVESAGHDPHSELFLRPLRKKERRVIV